VSEGVFNRVRALTEEHLLKRRTLIDERAALGVPRDTHGDLHLDHVYYFPEEAPPGDLVIIDCIEFSERFRYADPMADVAFLVMDLEFHGRRDLASIFEIAYALASGDTSGRPLVPFYAAYRAVVRAKVEGIELNEMEIAPAERHLAEQRARAHWLLALGELESPTRRPALVLIAGLPGSGKSTIARQIAEPANFHLLRSDVIRKELAGAAAQADSPAGFNEGIYSEAWTERTYAELLKRCEDLLWRGERVLIDANLRENRRRQVFFDCARRWGVLIIFIHCQAAADIVRARLEARRHEHDASDADWKVYQQLEQTWQPIPEVWKMLCHHVDTSGSIQENADCVRALLLEEGLIDG
jgi:predicted kinase